MAVSHHSLIDSLDLTLPSELDFVFDLEYSALCLLLPVTGWVAEAQLGRNRAITAGFYLLIFTELGSQASFIMLQLNWTPIPAFVLLCITLSIGIVGIGICYTNLLPFTLDQMIGASAEELSAVVHWYWWGVYVGLLMEGSVQCIPIPKSMHSQNFLPTVLLMLSTLCLLAVLISDCLFHKWLDTHHKIGNPIKLIFGVLNYARKNKYPRKRSAFTYLDEEQPSRLDFGKDEKFGGPFTEEEVEDVKTVLRLIPLLVCIAVPFLPINDPFYLHVILTNKQTQLCVATLSTLIQDSSVVLLIPAYRFFIVPVFYKYIPSMLRRIGAGLFLCFVSTLINLSLDTVGHLHSNTSHCMFDTSTGSIPIPIPVYWVMISDTVYGVGFTLVLCSLFEFIMAQTPNTMRGIMMGLGFTIEGISIAAGYLLKLLFHHLPATVTPSCGFYYYLVLSLLILLILVLFIIFAKRYKMRERDRHVNIQAIAEEHYERYFDQEEEYMKELADEYNH